MKLYGNPYSRANRVRWALEASGVTYDEETLELGPGGTGSESYRKINPNGLVPAIDDGGLVLFESVPICLYIAQRYAPQTLYVDTVEREAKLLQWSVWAMTELEKHGEQAALHLTWYPETKRDPRVAASEQAEVRRCLAMIEDAIRDQGFLVVDRFTIADLIVSEVMTSLVHTRIDLDEFPRVRQYLRGNLSQPSARRAFKPDILAPYLD